LDNAGRLRTRHTQHFALPDGRKLPTQVLLDVVKREISITFAMATDGEPPTNYFHLNLTDQCSMNGTRSLAICLSPNLKPWALIQ
jgi:hypothetical protein